MDPIFGVLILAFFAKNAIEDLSFSLRGQTSPRAARRQRQWDAATKFLTGRASKRAGRPPRRRAARAFVADAYNDAWHQAAERRQIRHEEHAPLKAERYRQKVADRAARQHARAQARRDRHTNRTANRNARHDTAAPEPENTPSGPTEPTTDPEPTPEPSEPADREKPVADSDREQTGPFGNVIRFPDPVGSNSQTSTNPAPEHAGETSTDTSTGTPDRPGAGSEAPTESTGSTGASSTGAGSAPVGSAEVDAPDPATDMPGPQTGSAADAASVTQQEAIQESTQEGATVNSGETTNLSSTLAALDEWQASIQQAETSLEQSIANLEAGEVGPSVTGPLSEARDGFQAAMAAIARARQELEPSVQIGDMYHSAPDAGSKEFVTN